MLRKLNIKFGYSIGLVLIIAVIAWILAQRTSYLVMPDYEFMIDTRNVLNADVKIGVSNKNGMSWEMRNSDTKYAVNIPTNICPEGINIDIEINKTTGEIFKASNNSEIISQEHIKALDNFVLNKATYSGFSVIKIKKDYHNRISFLIGLFIILWLGLSIVILRSLQLYKKYGGNFKFLPIYSSSALKYIKLKDILIAFGIFIVTFFIVLGGDATAIYESVKLYNNGLDIYQLQVNLRHFAGFQFPSFPYNPLMLYFWSDFTKLWDVVFNGFKTINSYPYFQIGILKLVNMALIIMTILSVISFLIDEKILNKKDVKSVFYLSLFNPLSFYVAIMFVQIDTLPMYLMTLGLLVLKDTEKNCYISGLLLSMALFMKMQLLIFLPIIGVVIIIIIFNSEKKPIFDKIKTLLIMLVLFISTGIIFFLLHYRTDHALYYLLKNFKQTERIWYTVLPYSPGLLLYISMFVIILLMMLNWFNYKSNLSEAQIIMNTIMINGSVTLVFSFAIINTPSILLHTTPAFILLYSIRKDFISKLFPFLLSTLMIVCVAFTDVGDISRIWYGWNGTLLFSKILNGLDDNGQIQFISVLFTISNTSMLAFGILFYKVSQKMLKNNKCCDLHNKSMSRLEDHMDNRSNKCE